VELAPISAKLNDLLTRVLASFERERRFSADVAHELRTPIAELRAIADVALRFPPEAIARTAAFEDVREAALQIDRLVTALRTLAACEAGRVERNVESVDLRALGQKLWTPFAAAAASKGLAVATPLPERPESSGRAVISSDPAILGSVITNLFANAVEYADAGGKVGWSVRTTSAGVELTVVNSNAALERTDLDHVFEAFWRKDAARTGGVHSGLGLSLARAFVELLEGELSLQIVTAGEVQARLWLPGRVVEASRRAAGG
jgi:two-component system sensor histidine kinase QseC